MTNDLRDKQINETHTNVELIKQDMGHIKEWIDRHELKHKEFKKSFNSKAWELVKMFIAAAFGAAGIYSYKHGF